LATPWLVALMLLAAGVLGFAGAFLGLRIGKELNKAGILKTA
jgi:hypothetical protein